MPTAFVTGASRGIGRAIAETLAGEGMNLALVARSRDQLESLSAALPTRSLVCAVDLRKPEVPAEVVASTVSHFGRLDLLVNNASSFFPVSVRGIAGTAAIVSGT